MSYLPGPGDLDPGPAACLGGACPHDHGDPSECGLCGDDFWPTVRRDVCVACAPLLDMDAAALRQLVIEQRGEVAFLRRAQARRILDGV